MKNFLKEKEFQDLLHQRYNNECVKKFPLTITRLFKTGIFEKIMLFNRERELIYHSDENKETAKNFIQKEFERKWTKEEYSKFLSEADYLIKKMISRKAEDIEIEIAKAEIKELTEKINLEPVKKQKNKLKIKEKGTKLLRK